VASYSNYQCVRGGEKECSLKKKKNGKKARKKNGKKKNGKLTWQLNL
jgi:hypothetical protein